MKSLRKTVLIGALLSCSVAVGTTAMAADPVVGTSPSVDHPMHFRGGHGPMEFGAGQVDGPFMHALHRLNLSAEQQTTIRGYLATAKQQMRANVATPPSVEALANPGDPNYLSAIAAAKNLAATRIQQRSDLQVQIYGLLTPDQQAKLPQVLAEMKTLHEQQRAEWQQRHKNGAAPAN